MSKKWWAKPTLQSLATKIIIVLMPDYRRILRPGGTFFFTICTNNRLPLFSEPKNINLLRTATRQVLSERPFTINAAVILPDHLHWLWTLPDADKDYSARIGRLKILFTRALRNVGWAPPTTLSQNSPSRTRHHESPIWQRRFWEHTIRDQDDFNNHLNYIHYNPVKHNHASCPHAWAASSFQQWVRRDAYPADWCCICNGANPPIRLPYPDNLDTGE